MIKIISAILCIGCVVVMFIFRFKHPELTETQLFLECWTLIIPLFISGIVFYIEINNDKEKQK